jgi:hypothetical protein
VSSQDGMGLDVHTGIIADGQAKVLNVFAVAVAR